MRPNPRAPRQVQHQPQHPVSIPAPFHGKSPPRVTHPGRGCASGAWEPGGFSCQDLCLVLLGWAVWLNWWPFNRAWDGDAAFWALGVLFKEGGERDRMRYRQCLLLVSIHDIDSVELLEIRAHHSFWTMPVFQHYSFVSASHFLLVLLVSVCWRTAVFGDSFEVGSSNALAGFLHNTLLTDFPSKRDVLWV